MVTIIRGNTMRPDSTAPTRPICTTDSRMAPWTPVRQPIASCTRIHPRERLRSSANSTYCTPSFRPWFLWLSRWPERLCSSWNPNRRPSSSCATHPKCFVCAISTISHWRSSFWRSWVEVGSRSFYLWKIHLTNYGPSYSSCIGYFNSVLKAIL